MPKLITIPSNVKLSKTRESTLLAVDREDARLAEYISSLEDPKLDARRRYAKVSMCALTCTLRAVNVAHLIRFDATTVRSVITAFGCAAVWSVNDMRAHTEVGWADMRPSMAAFEVPWLGRCAELILDYEFPERPIPAEGEIGMEDVYPKYWLARVRGDRHAMAAIVEVMATRTWRQHAGSALSREVPDPKVLAAILQALDSRDIEAARVAVKKLLAWHDRLATPRAIRPGQPVETGNMRLICLEACAIAAAAWKDGLDLGDLGPYVPRALICDTVT